MSVLADVLLSWGLTKGSHEFALQGLGLALVSQLCPTPFPRQGPVYGLCQMLSTFIQLAYAEAMGETFA